MDTIFSKNLRTARKALKLTQVQFAGPLGITNGYVSDLEKGKVGRPSEPLLQAIEYHYRINRKWLLTGQGEMFLDEPLVKAEVESASVDLELLSYVIEGVESELHTRNAELSAHKKARVIALLYDYFSKAHQAPTAEKIKEYVALVVES